MPCVPLALTLFAVAVAHSAKEEQDPDSVFLLQTGVDLSSTLEKATATRQSITLAQVESVAQNTHGSHVIWRAVFAEYIAMTLFVIVGCGSAMTIAKEVGAAWILQVAFSFGLAITTLVWGIGRYSGGQINCAVTLALWICGNIGFAQALLNFIAQVLGSITGAIILCVLFPKELDKTGNLACNLIGEGWHFSGVFLGEFAMTFLLVMTVLESLQRTTSPGFCALPIGFAVFLAHCLLIPMDGCSINPTRSFGPALVASFRNDKVDCFKHHSVFWIGPLAGAAVAAGIHSAFMA